jgi:hypothetical protein
MHDAKFVLLDQFFRLLERSGQFRFDDFLRSIFDPENRLDYLYVGMAIGNSVMYAPL